MGTARQEQVPASALPNSVLQEGLGETVTAPPTPGHGSQPVTDAGGEPWHRLNTGRPRDSLQSAKPYVYS